MYSTMTPTKAFAWTSAYVLALSFLFWSGLSDFVAAAYRHWFVDYFFLCLSVPLSLFIYRRYRKGGGDNSFFTNIPKRQHPEGKIVGAVILICAATFEIALGTWKASDHRMDHFAMASVWLVLGADMWRRYLELKGPEVSARH